MSTLQPSVARLIQTGTVALGRVEPLLGLLVGALGGVSVSALLATSTVHGLTLGALFGLTFGLFFALRAANPGAGLMWGLSCAFLLWVVLPAGMIPLLGGSARSATMLRDARDRFPELVAYLICLGLPVGVALGWLGNRRYRATQPDFHWGRAVVAGGFSGMLSSLIFSRWMYVGEFFPLLSGMGEMSSRTTAVS